METGNLYLTGDPSTLHGLAKNFADSVDIKIWEDILVMQAIVDFMEEGDMEILFTKDEMRVHESSSLPMPSADKQLVYLNFNNGGNYTAIVNGVPFFLPAHVYSMEEQMEILEKLQKDYEDSILNSQQTQNSLANI